MERPDTPPHSALLAAGAGCALIGVAVTLLLASELGADPFTVVIDGASHSLGLPLWAANLTVAAVLLTVACVLGHRLRAINIINPLIVSTVLFVLIPLTTLPDNPTVKAAAAVAGVIVLGVGTGLCLTARLGAGHVEAVPVALSAKGVSLNVVMTAQLFVFVAVGWLLGSRLVGFATLFGALAVAPIAAGVLAVHRRLVPTTATVVDA
jgi:uncharacterized membrane protein YczE